MKIEFYLKKPIDKRKMYDALTDEQRHQPKMPVVTGVHFCCQDMADNFMQLPCFLHESDGQWELWFHPSQNEHADFFMRYCPFCGNKIQAVETNAAIPSPAFDS